jgi:predicted GIY-YIG superfamily endonuclease
MENKMKHYVYVLMNEYGTVEYVGYSKNLKQRFDNHTKSKPEYRNGNGKFYGRTDLIMEVIKEFPTKKEAEEYEGELKLQLGFEWTEKTRNSKAGKIGGKIGGRKNIGNGIIHAETPISTYGKDTGEYVGTYPSMKECARQLNLYTQNIYHFFNGRYKQTGGYTFKKETK